MVSPGSQFNKVASLAPSDSVDLPQITEAIWVGGAGVVAAIFADNTVQNFTVPAGTLLPIKVKRVNLTNTTATLMVALYQN